MQHLNLHLWQKVLPRDHSDTSSAGEAELLRNGMCGMELVIYQGLPIHPGHQWLQSADNFIQRRSTDGDTQHASPSRIWDNASAALCLDFLRRRGKASWV